MRFAEIESHIGSIGELRDIIGAMRSLAGIRVQEAQRALSAAQRYQQIVADAVGAAMALVPASTPAAGVNEGRRGFVLCMAEHGFVGGFNERLLAAAAAALAGDDVLFVLGSRGAARVAESGRKVDWCGPMAIRAGAIVQTVRHLSAELYHRIASGNLTRLCVMFARHPPAAAEIVETRQLLPLVRRSAARSASRLAALHNLPPQVLLEEMIADHVFAVLVEAAVETFASENAARFAAMQSAHDNISKRLDQLQREARLARQEEITSELLELVAGTQEQILKSS